MVHTSCADPPTARRPGHFSGPETRKPGNQKPEIQYAHQSGANIPGTEYRTVLSPWHLPLQIPASSSFT